MSNFLCKSSVFKTYQEVISDVIQNVREPFLEDGIDEAVLQEFKSLWETKLAATKAVPENKEIEKSSHSSASKNSQKIAKTQSEQLHNVGEVRPNNHISHWKRLPVKLTIPSSITSIGNGTNAEQRVLSIEVPEVLLQGHYLKSILTGPIIGATLNLPTEAAATFLQDQVNEAFLKYQQSSSSSSNNNNNNNSIADPDKNANNSKLETIIKL